jgi:hypothetical protein
MLALSSSFDPEPDDRVGLAGDASVAGQPLLCDDLKGDPP